MLASAEIGCLAWLQLVLGWFILAGKYRAENGQIVASSNLNVRIDEDLRSRATQVLANYGLSPNQAIKLFFNQVVSTGKVPLSFDWADTQVLTSKAKAVAQPKQPTSKAQVQPTVEQQSEPQPLPEPPESLINEELERLKYLQRMHGSAQDLG